jgi:hypothetical protein
VIAYRRAPAAGGMRTPVEIAGPIGEVTLVSRGRRSALMDCVLARALVQAGEVFKELGIAAVTFSAAYDNRTRRGSSGPSAHAYGLAIDVHSVRGPFGEYDVRKHFEPGIGTWRGLRKGPEALDACIGEPVTTEGKLLRRLACGLKLHPAFRVIVSPDDNSDHRDHLHIEAGADFFPPPPGAPPLPSPPQPSPPRAAAGSDPAATQPATARAQRRGTRPGSRSQKKQKARAKANAKEKAKAKARTKAKKGECRHGGDLQWRIAMQNHGTPSAGRGRQTAGRGPKLTDSRPISAADYADREGALNVLPRVSSSSSVMSSTSAQVSLAASARRTIDPTVDTPTPTLPLIVRCGRSSTSRCPSISRVLRMDSRSVAISPPLKAGTLPSVAPAISRPGTRDHAVERLITMLWNGRSRCSGTADHDAVESAIAMVRNTQVVRITASREAGEEWPQLLGHLLRRSDASVLPPSDATQSNWPPSSRSLTLNVIASPGRMPVSSMVAAARASGSPAVSAVCKKTLTTK